MFPDSRHGRQFADDVLNGLHNGLGSQAAVAAAVRKWNAWTFGRSLARETGLPQNTLYLHGLVVVVSMQ